MYWFLLCFCAGVLAVNQLPVLPPLDEACLLIIGALLGIFRRATRPLAAVLTGLLFAIWSGHGWFDQLVPRNMEGLAQTIVVRVSEVPERRGERVSFRALVLSGALKDRRLQLYWLEAEPPQVGEIWLLTVKLFRPRGLANPGLFDYQGWLLSQDIHGSGYVVPGGQIEKRQRAPPLWFYVQQLRQTITLDLETKVVDPVVRGALLALVIGNSANLSEATWTTLTRTGTNHLFIVSGLHLGLVAGVLFGCFKLFGIGLKATVAVAIPILIGYALLVGFGLPVQRALVMCITGFVLLLIKRNFQPVGLVVIAMAAVLLVNPFAVLSAGFWLSFSAVLGLLLGFAGWQLQTTPVYFTLLRTQWVALLSTAPLLLLWIAEFSMLSVVSNMIAVPLLGFVIVPMVLSYLLMTMLGFTDSGTWVLELVSAILEWVLDLLNLISQQSWSHTFWLEVEVVLGLILLGSVLMLLPRGLVPRWLGLYCWLPVFAPLEPEEAGYLKIQVLDVGQGLAVLLTSPNATIVYDTGPSSITTDAGKQVLLPMLRQSGRKEIDLLVVSHGDDDHAGGALSLQRGIPVRKTISSDQQYGSPCNDGRALYPDLSVRWFARRDANSRNAASCIVIIQSDYGSVLLPGDVGIETERELLAQFAKADLLIAPHHGSLSSSSPALLNRVAPSWVVFSSGYNNAFGHPHEEVVARYENRGVRHYSTAKSGAMTFLFSQEGVQIIHTRNVQRRFWYDAD